MRYVSCLFGCLLLCLGLAPRAWAQQTLGTVSVIVVDTSGAPVPGALLSLTDLATNDTRRAVSQEAGNYTFVNLNFGQFKLTVTLPDPVAVASLANSLARLVVSAPRM